MSNITNANKTKIELVNFFTGFKGYFNHLSVAKADITKFLPSFEEYNNAFNETILVASHTESCDEILTKLEDYFSTLSNVTVERRLAGKKNHTGELIMQEVTIRDERLPLFKTLLAL